MEISIPNVILGIFVESLFFLILDVSSLQYSNDLTWNDDKVVLSPAELVNLVRQEQMLQGDLQPPGQEPGSQDLEEGGARTAEADDEGIDDEDVARLKTRKVWSRWSKWGQCSATCGLGVVARRRICVAGRCAQGEREEQRRACVMPPCASADYDSRAPTSTDDVTASTAGDEDPAPVDPELESDAV